MASKMGSISTTGMKKLQKQMNQLQQGELDSFLDSCAKELAARLLAKAIKRTPVGDYSNIVEVEVTAKRNSKHHKKGDVYTVKKDLSSKKGGTLRRGWTARSHEEAAGGQGKSSQNAGRAYAESLKVNHFGNYYVVEIINPVEYASYVEYGHRTPGGAGWVQGQFMLTISEQEIQKIAPNVLEMKIKDFLKGVM